MMRMAQSHDVEPRILQAVDIVNTSQKTILLTALDQHFGSRLAGRRIAIWGLAFKPRTDDVREAPSLIMIEALLERGVKLVVHDPVAMENVRKIFGNHLEYAATPEESLQQVAALIVMTEWGEFRHPDFDVMREKMQEPIIFDGRNLYEPSQMKEAGFVYYSIGRPMIRPE